MYSGDTVLSFGMNSESYNVNISKKMVDGDVDLVDASTLANFFSDIARGLGFDTTGVAIYMGDTQIASDY